MLNAKELAVAQHTHPNPPFEKGGRSCSKLFAMLEEVGWVNLCGKVRQKLSVSPWYFLFIASYQPNPYSSKREEEIAS